MWRLLEAIPSPIKTTIAIGKTTMTMPMGPMRKRMLPVGVPMTRMHTHMMGASYVASIAVLEACG